MQVNLYKLYSQEATCFWKQIITRKIFKHLNDLKSLQSNHFFLSESQELVIFSNIFIIAIVANYPIHLQRKIGNHLNYISLPTKETIRNNLKHSIRDCCLFSSSQ